MTSPEPGGRPADVLDRGLVQDHHQPGGKLIGFGNNQTGSSTNYDRHIYMMNDGQLVFGVWNNQTETIETPNVYNDGAWHYVVATYTHGGTWRCTSTAS